MGVVTSLEDTHLVVAAGEEVVCEVLVRNSGDLVDQFAVDVVGSAESWAAAEPDTVNLLPGAEASIRVVFSPPRSPDVLAGVVPFGVRVQSREDPHGSVVEEGDVEVAPFTSMAAEVVPPKARGSRRAKYRLAVDNNGNRETPVEVVAIDPDDELRITVEPMGIITRPGTATVVRAVAAPHRRFLRGDPKNHQFQLVVLPDGQDPITTNATMVQLPLLPRWLLPALAALVVLAGILVALWFTLFKPAVTSIAQEATQQQASQAVSAAAQADKAADKASKAADAAQSGGAAGAAGGAAGGGAGGANGTASGKGGAGGASTAKAAGGQNGGAGASKAAAPVPSDFRIAASATTVTDNSFQDFSYTAPNHKPMSIGDLVLQNPRGDTGILQVIIGGQVVLEEGMANFRDLDYHYVDALHVAAGQPVTLAVSCSAPGPGATRCTPSVSFSAQLG
jgi:hypothetical protein